MITRERFVVTRERLVNPWERFVFRREGLWLQGKDCDFNRRFVITTEGL